MSDIHDEDPFFNEKIAEEYINLLKTNAFLRPAQQEWLQRHGTIRVTIASGCACFDPKADRSAHVVLERADELMYACKKQMKGKRK